MLTLTGVVVGVIDADGVEDDWNENAHAIVSIGPPETRILYQVYLSKGWPQDRFRIDEETHLRVDITAPKKGRLRFTLIEIAADEEVHWRTGKGKVRRNGTEHPTEQLAITQ